MRVLIVGIIVLAISVAGVSTYLIKNFSGKDNIQKLEEKAKVKVFKVLVAGRDIAIGTLITDADLTWQVWPENVLNKQFIATDDEKLEDEKSKEFVGSITRHAIKTGEPVLVAKVFKRADAGFMSGMLEGGMRAVSVKVTEISGVSGFIMPGDYVDVVMTQNNAGGILKKGSKKSGKNNSGNATMALISALNVYKTATEVVLRNVRVIATDQSVASPEKDANAVKAHTLTLEVTPKQAEIVITAQAMGKLSLILRSAEKSPEESDKRTFTTDIETSILMKTAVNKLLGMKKNAKVSKSRPRVASPVRQKVQVKRNTQKKQIKIYRGGAASTETLRATK